MAIIGVGVSVDGIGVGVAVGDSGVGVAVDGIGVGVAVGDSRVGAGGTGVGVAMDCSGVAVAAGASATGGGVVVPHSTKNNITRMTALTCCRTCQQFIVDSFRCDYSAAQRPQITYAGLAAQPTITIIFAAPPSYN